jgi:imidazolonepropionase-like amidohydrolase
MNKLTTLVLAVTLCLTVSASGYDYVPGEPQSRPILLRGGDLYTVANGVLPATDLLFDNGRITGIGPDLTPPDNCRVIDVTGKRVYPGMIDGATTLGLIEIDEVRATDDRSEVGRITPEVAAWVAYNPDSELLPAVRANGVTTALVVPNGSLVRGRSSLMNLDGWTREDAAEKSIVAVHLSWPRSRIITAWWMEQSVEEQQKQIDENRRALQQVFVDARAYAVAHKANPAIDIDLRWEAMLPLFSKELPLVIHADDATQIEDAVMFGQREDIPIILAGAREAYRMLDLLKKYDIPIILTSTYRTPMREDDDYNTPYSLAGTLEKAGIRFCIASFGNTGCRNLPFQAGMAHAFGLSLEGALRSVTLSPAEILGVADDLGSLEIGKKATLVVSDGDMLDHIGHNVTMEFIEGAAVDLNSKHKELFEKYKQKHYSPDK